MLPLSDMLAAQNGLVMEALQRQFSLTQHQTQQVVETLLPAFSTGLKNNVADPYGVGAFLQTLASGNHANYFDNPMSAFTPGGQAAGNDVLGQIFGSKELSRAVAAHAATATGIGQEVIKQMLPAMAAMIMGGLFKQASGQLGPGVQPNFGNAGLGGATNPMGAILAEMMRQAGALTGGQPQPRQPDPMANPFGRMMQDMFGGAQAAAQNKASDASPKSPFDAFGQNPFGKAMQDMMDAWQPRQQPEPEPEPSNPSGRPRTPWDDIFDDMFETGAKQRDEVQKNMETIVGEFLKGMNRQR
ncbi:DUF937 domain-containing protein [Aquibium carbonis]|uniref:DUF937 domain-containing protein n=1 Tax=Aquibium carbonis TaxID=2495581 RepID=A0A429YUX7_9HYPH|nr:DUF937 domain-containing protein [Aquibium carbonis]RST85268.1 DUF937 domain-containing protein [Aquibium carbonis]